MSTAKRINAMYLNGTTIMNGMIEEILKKKGMTIEDEAGKAFVQEIGFKTGSTCAETLMSIIKDAPLITVIDEDDTEWLYGPLLNLDEFAKEYGISYTD